MIVVILVIFTNQIIVLDVVLIIVISKVGPIR